MTETITEILHIGMIKMKKINFRLAVICVLMLVVASCVSASVSALEAGSDILDSLTSAVIDMGGVIGGLIPTTEEKTTKAPVNIQDAEEELGNILDEIGIGTDILKITDLISYLNRGGSFADWIYDNYGTSIEIPDSVKNMPTADLVMYLMSSVLYPDTTPTKEPTTPGYVFVPDKNDKETTTKKNYTTVPETTTRPAYKTGDVDGDSVITAKDARLALRASAKLETLYATPFDAADVNGDGRVTANDARSILRYSAKLTNGF